MTYKDLKLPISIPEEEPTFLDEAIKSIARKALSSAGAILLYKYGISSDTFAPLSYEIVGVVSGIGALVYSTIWGVLNKKKLVNQIEGQ